MYENLKSKLVQDMVKNGMIDKEDTELYCFGIDALKTYVGAIIMTLGIGVLLHSFWESLVFLIFFKLLRGEAGGYHASSKWMCNLVSVLSITGTLLIVRFYGTVFPIWLVGISLFLSVVVIFIWAPLPDSHKPITEKERIYHKKHARAIVIMESVVAVLLYNPMRKLSVVICLAEVILTISLMIWLVVRRFHPQES